MSGADIVSPLTSAFHFFFTFNFFRWQIVFAFYVIIFSKEWLFIFLCVVTVVLYANRTGCSLSFTSFDV